MSGIAAYHLKGTNMSDDDFEGRINHPPYAGHSEIPRAKARVEFAKRLYRAMVKRGWNQSELAREADRIVKETNPEARIGRDKVSSYMRAQSLPKGAILEALAKAVKMKPEELLPDPGIDGRTTRFGSKSHDARYETFDNAPPVEVRYQDDGNVWLRLNRPVDQETALKILHDLNEYDKSHAPN